MQFEGTRQPRCEPGHRIRASCPQGHGGQTYRCAVGKTMELSLDAGKYQFVFRQVNFGEELEGSEVSADIAINGPMTVSVMMGAESRFEAVVG